MVQDRGTTIEGTEAPPTPTRTVSPRTGLWTFFLALLVFCGMAGSWALASPIMSLPDEPSHAVHAAAVVRGELDATVVHVPEYIAISDQYPCFAFRSAVPATCQRGVPDDGTLTRAGTSAGTYDPLYYEIVGWPTLVTDDGRLAIYAMRAMGVLLNGVMLALAAVAIMGLRRRGFGLIALGVAVTPSVLFLTGGINPNSLEITAAVATFAWLVNTVQHVRAGDVAPHRFAFVAVGAIALANTRSIAPLWLLILLVATLADLAVLRALIRVRAFWVAVACIALGVGFSAVWTLRTNSLAVTIPNPGVGTGFGDAFLMMLGTTFDEVGGYVGLFGWLDTPAPVATVGLWAAGMLVLVVGALVLARRPARTVVIVMTVAFVLVPPIVQGQAAHDYGFIWQARYLLAIVCTLVLAAGVALDQTFPDAFRDARMRTFALITVVVMAIVHVHTYLWVLKRYMAGIDGGWGALFRGGVWLPPLGWLPWTLTLAVAAALGVVLVLRAIATDTRRPAVETARVAAS